VAGKLADVSSIRFVLGLMAIIPLLMIGPIFFLPERGMKGGTSSF